MHGLAAPDGTTKYVDQMVGIADEQISIETFSWRLLLTSRFDILHLHWPENLVRARTPLRRTLKRMLSFVLLARLKAGHFMLVRTVHNEKAHEKLSGFDRWLVEEIEKSTDEHIILNKTTKTPEHSTVLIPHGHYRDRYAFPARDTGQTGRILYFGLIRPYKQVAHLLRVFGSLPPELGYKLKVVGKPFSEELRTEIESLVARNPRASALLDFVPDDILAEEITSARLIVLPYAEMHNSGAALLALSLDRAVLMPSSPANVALREEVGSEWVFLYHGDQLSPADLLAAMHAVERTSPGERPRLSGRDWAHVAKLHRDVYVRLVQTAHESTRR